MKLFELMNDPSDGGDGGGDDEWEAGRRAFEAKAKQYLDMLIQKGEPLQIYDPTGRPDTLNYDNGSWVNQEGDDFTNEEMPQLMSQDDQGNLIYNY